MDRFMLADSSITMRDIVKGASFEELNDFFENGYNILEYLCSQPLNSYINNAIKCLAKKYPIFITNEAIELLQNHTMFATPIDVLKANNPEKVAINEGELYGKIISAIQNSNVKNLLRLLRSVNVRKFVCEYLYDDEKELTGQFLCNIIDLAFFRDHRIVKMCNQNVSTSAIEKALNETVEVVYPSTTVICTDVSNGNEYILLVRIPSVSNIIKLLKDKLGFDVTLSELITPDFSARKVVHRVVFTSVREMITLII